MNPDRIDALVDHLCMVLDAMGEIPLSLREARAHQFEKYPRELLASLEKHGGDPQLALPEWLTRIQRLMLNPKDKEYGGLQIANVLQETERLRGFISENFPHFDRETLRHLRASLLARVLATMANCWELARAYSYSDTGASDKFTPESINRDFARSVMEELQRIPESRRNAILELAKKHVLFHIPYYRAFTKEGRGEN